MPGREGISRPLLADEAGFNRQDGLTIELHEVGFGIKKGRNLHSILSNVSAKFESGKVCGIRVREILVHASRL